MNSNTKKRKRSPSPNTDEQPHHRRKYIKFYSKSKDKSIQTLSNFAEIPVQLKHDGDVQLYPTGEHAFHASKYRIAAKTSGITATREKELIAHARKFTTNAASSPLDAKRLGGKGKAGLRLMSGELVLWNKSAGDIQRRICRYKLKNNPSVQAALDATGHDCLLHQDNRAKPDNRWGGRLDKSTGKVIGKNELGRIWEELRAATRQQDEPPSADA